MSAGPLTETASVVAEVLRQCAADPETFANLIGAKFRPAPVVWSIPQTAKALGVSATTVRRLIREEGLPCVRLLEGRIVLRPDAVAEWLEGAEQ
jgi:excisionase family DNA binding protein